MRVKTKVAAIGPFLRMHWSGVMKCFWKPDWWLLNYQLFVFIALLCVSEASSRSFPVLVYARELAPPMNRPHKAGHKNDINNIKYNQCARTTGYTRKSRGQTRTYVRLVAECSPLRFERCHECQWTVYSHKNLHMDDYALGLSRYVFH
jgi:hypothetical protein